MSVTIEEIKRIVANQLGIAEVLASHRFAEDLGAESADLVNVVAAVEDRFGVLIDEPELAGIATVDDLYHLTQRLGVTPASS